MGAGGIIQKHVKVLLPAVNDPSFYQHLSATQKDVVEAINVKGSELEYTEADRAALVDMIADVARG